MYDQVFERHASFLKALANPRRLEIIHLLRDQELCVSDIYDMLDLPQANISQHLQVLRDEGVVTTRRDGKHVYYQLAHPNIIAASDLLRAVILHQTHDATTRQALSKLTDAVQSVTHDPVCGMRVSPHTAAFHHHHHDSDYFFCASGCYQTFIKEPDQYVK